MSFENKKFEPLPDGDYSVRMIQLDAKKSKAGDDMMTARFQIISGPEGVEGAKNRLIFENFMLTHSNPKAVQAGLGKLSKYAEAVGITGENLEAIKGGDPTILNNTLETPFVATLGEKAPWNGKIDNTIKQYKSR